MAHVEESQWVDLSSRDDRDSGRRRFVKTMGVEGGFGRALRIEIVAEAGAGIPPEEVATYSLYEWLAGRG